MPAWVGGTLPRFVASVRGCAGRAAKIALLLAAGPLWAQETAAQTAVIRGAVTGGDGEPLEGVVVTLQNPDTQVVTRGITGKNGHYWIAGVPAGPGYRLVFGRIGLATILRGDISVSAGDTLTVDARLSREEAIELDGIVVEGRRRSPLARRIRAPVTAEEISGREGMLTGRDILRLLRPNAVASRVHECGGTELKVFVDGVRADWPMDTVALLLSSQRGADLLLSDLPPTLRKLVARRQPDDAQGLMRALRESWNTQSNLYAVWLALGRVRAREIERAEFVSCTDSSVPIAARNSIWIVTKRETSGW